MDVKGVHFWIAMAMMWMVRSRRHEGCPSRSTWMDVAMVIVNVVVTVDMDGSTRMG